MLVLRVLPQVSIFQSVNGELCRKSLCSSGVAVGYWGMLSPQLKESEVCVFYRLCSAGDVDLCQLLALSGLEGGYRGTFKICWACTSVFWLLFGTHGTEPQGRNAVIEWAAPRQSQVGSKNLFICLHFVQVLQVICILLNRYCFKISSLSTENWNGSTVRFLAAVNQWDLCFWAPEGVPGALSLCWL